VAGRPAQVYPERRVLQPGQYAGDQDTWPGQICGARKAHMQQAAFGAVVESKNDLVEVVVYLTRRR
jgi:hypothetical protein